MTSTAADDAGYSKGVNLTIGLCLTYTICISCVRVWIRRGAFGADDLVIGIATLITFGHTAADYGALANGLGLPWRRIANEDHLRSLDAASEAAVVTFTTALYLSKCAVVVFVSRITTTHSRKTSYHVCNAVLAVLGAISILIVTVSCPTDSGYYWAFDQNALSSCPSQSTRWQAFTALDIVTEILLLVLPVQLVWGLQMPRTKKAMIIVAFYLRIPVIAFALGRNYYTLRLREPSADAGLVSGLVVVWLEIQLAYALAASTLSASKAFTESFNSGFGLGFTRGKGDESYGLSDFSGRTPDSSKTDKSIKDSSILQSSSGRSTTNAAPPGSVSEGRRSDRPNSPTLPPAEPPLKLRPGAAITSYTSVFANPDLAPWRDTNSTSTDSPVDDMVIVRETGYDVHHDEAPMLRPATRNA